MELVTGKAGTDHISAADLAAMYRGLLIADDCVLDEGDKLSCTMLDANTAEIGTGSCMLQDHHARIDVAEQVTIESGSPGYNRNDLIVARYTLGTGNIQGVYLAVIKGTATLGEATDPSYTSGSIDGGDVLVEFPLWRIPLTGITVGDPERIMPTIDTLQAQITSVRDSVAPAIHNGMTLVTVWEEVSSYTCPADGWYTFSIDSADGRWAQFQVNNSILLGVTNGAVIGTFPLKKNTKLYTRSGLTNTVYRVESYMAF